MDLHIYGYATFVTRNTILKYFLLIDLQFDFLALVLSSFLIFARHIVNYHVDVLVDVDLQVFSFRSPAWFTSNSLSLSACLIISLHDQFS